MRVRRATLRGFGAGLLLALAGCATYHAQPLPTDPRPASSLAELHGGGDVATPLDLPSLERLVLLNAPDLAGLRAQHQLARAQARQAGLLPNPVIGASEGWLLSGPGDATAWTAGISQDIRALITLRPRREAAKAGADEIDASLLWLEWQTLARARMLFVDVQADARLVQLRQDGLSLLEQRDRQLRQSIAAGNGELASTSALFAASADARNALDEAQRSELADRHALNALLNLAPEVALPLATQAALPALDDVAANQDIDSIERRRPDLVALQLGYQAQEANLRAAVLTQFPALSIGYQAAQDNSRVRSGGPSLNVELPMFDRGRAGVTAASATRQQLRDEYIARVASAKGEIAALLAERQQARRQSEQLATSLSEFDRAAAQASLALARGDLDSRGFVELATAAQARHEAASLLEKQMQEQQVALTALLGAGMPVTLPQDVIAP